MMRIATDDHSGRLVRIYRLWPLLLPVLILVPALQGFAYPPGESLYSDITVAHYPYTLYLRRSLWETHTVPLWSPGILSGAPFAANPLAGLWYPPGWLALLLPLPFAFNLLVLLHLLWAGLGMYNLMRQEGLSHLAALCSALAFEALPKLFAHYGAGHLTLLYAACWTPWLLYVLRRRLDSGRVGFAWWQGLFLALLFLADVRWAPYAGVLWCGYALLHRSLGTNVENRTEVQSDITRDRGERGLHLPRPAVKDLFTRSGGLLQQAALAGSLIAPLGLPLLELARLSTRASMTTEDILAFSLPPGRLLGLLFADFGGFHEWMLYPGAMIFVLGLLAVFWYYKQREIKFWAWLALASLFFSLGENIPGLSVLAHLPGWSLLRVPSRALFLAGLALAALAGYAVEHLLSDITVGDQAERDRRRANLLLLALNAFGVVLLLVVWSLTGKLPFEFAWSTGVILMGSLLVVTSMSEKLPTRIWLAGLVGVCLLDWTVVNRSLFTVRDPASVFAQGQPVAQELSTISLAAEGPFRVYSPSISIPQHTAANYGLQLADGIDPLQLKTYVAFMERATGVPRMSYSVTLPPFASGEPLTDNAAYSPRADLLGLLNVRFIAAAYDLHVDGLDLLARFGDVRLYENQRALPRAWVQPADAQPGVQARPVQWMDWEPNHIEVNAEGPGLLVLSEIYIPGWQAWVDGAPMSIQEVGGLLRGVQVGAGVHHVLIRYRPASLLWGLLACGSAIIFLIFHSVLGRKRRVP